MKYTADQVSGNRLRLLEDVEVFKGSPGSMEPEIWNRGFLTPPVYSYVIRNGQLYWMIGELSPVRYVQHKEGSFDLVPDSGGADYITPEAGPGFFSDLGGVLDLVNSENIGRAIKGGLVLAGGFLVLKVYDILK